MNAATCHDQREGDFQSHGARISANARTPLASSRTDPRARSATTQGGVPASTRDKARSVEERIAMKNYGASRRIAHFPDASSRYSIRSCNRLGRPCQNSI